MAEEEFEVIRVKVAPGVKDAFAAACKAEDLNASQVLRRFIRQYLKEHAQGELLERQPKRGRK